MGAIIFLLAIFAALVLFAYLAFPPAHGDKRLIGVFNRMVLGVCALLCFVWFLYARAEWMGTIDDRWWLPLGVAGALAIEISFLTVFFILRNFWIFRVSSRHRGGWL